MQFQIKHDELTWESICREFRVAFSNQYSSELIDNFFHAFKPSFDEIIHLLEQSKKAALNAEVQINFPSTLKDNQDFRTFLNEGLSEYTQKISVITGKHFSSAFLASTIIREFNRYISSSGNTQGHSLH